MTSPPRSPNRARSLTPTVSMHDLSGSVSAVSVSSSGLNVGAYEVNPSNFTPTVKGFVVPQGHNRGFSAHDLRSAGYSASQLRNAGFSPSELRAIGLSVQLLYRSGFTASELISSYSVAQIHGVLPAEECLRAGLDAADLFPIFSATELHGAFSAKELKDAGATLRQLLDTGGYKTTELLDAGFSPLELKQTGMNAQTLINAGVDFQRLGNIGFSARSLRQEGFSAKALQSGYEKKDAPSGVTGVEAASLDRVLSLSAQFNVVLVERYGEDLKRSWIKLFRLIDREGNGLISYVEFKDAVRNLLGLPRFVTSDQDIVAIWRAITQTQKKAGSLYMTTGEFGAFMRYGSSEEAIESRASGTLKADPRESPRNEPSRIGPRKTISRRPIIAWKQPKGT